MDQIKRKIKYHIDKYKEASDWNRHQPGGHSRDCDHFDIMDRIMETRDVVNLPHVVAAGLEDETIEENDAQQDSSTALAEPTELEEQ